MLERDMIKRDRNIVVSTIRGRKLRDRFERKFALIRDIVYFSFAAASLVGPLSAFRFISPARVMIRQYLPRWHMAKRKGGAGVVTTWPFLPDAPRLDIGNAKSYRTSPSLNGTYNSKCDFDAILFSLVRI